MKEMVKRSQIKKINIKHKNVVIADSNSTDQIKEIICPNPNCGLIIHTRKSQGNLTCPHCLFEFEVEKTRKRSKPETPRGGDTEIMTKFEFLITGILKANNTIDAKQFLHELMLNGNARTTLPMPPNLRPVEFFEVSVNEIDD